MDIRIPTGLLFGIIGAILVVFGAVTAGDAMYVKSLGINVNLWWGLVLLVFAAAMLGLAWRAANAKGRMKNED